MKHLLFVLVVTMVVGCAPMVPVENLRRVPAADMAESSKIRVFTLESGATYPPVASVLGEVSAYSCKHWMTDPPASKGDALKRLRLAAYRLQADAVIDVTFDTRGTDALGTNCWESVFASGQAVKFKQ